MKSKDLFEKQILLAKSDKEELVDEILRLRNENRKLKEQLEKLKEKEETKKANIQINKRARKRRKKRPGREKGHAGTTRLKPAHIDHIIEQTLNICPDCGSKHLTEAPSADIEHIQEDIIPARIEVTKFVRHGYWCPCCHTVKIAGYVPEEIPYGYLGPNILVQTVLMKYHLGLSYGKIRQFYDDFCCLKVTESALAQALQRMAQWLNIEESVIMAAIRASPYLHIDETGWKIAGINHWLWNFVNERLALYRIRRSRGRAVPNEILSKEYQGVVISDFLSAYDKSGRKRQRCLVHLRRDMKKIQKIDQTQESKKAYKKLKRILTDAYRLEEIRLKLPPWIFYRRLNRLKDRLCDFSCEPYKSKHWNRISKRLIKYYHEILTFVQIPKLPSHNNHAERMIRPNVIFRKISFQNMSDKGARAHEVMMSILQTLRLRDQNPISFFKKAYLLHRKGNLSPILPT